LLGGASDLAMNELESKIRKSEGQLANPQPRVRTKPRILRFVTRSVTCALLLFSGGCALHYYDKSSATEHLWGFGHMKMRAVPQRHDEPPFSNAVIAFVTGVRTAGLNFGAGSEFAGIGAGWDSRSRLIIRAEGAEFFLLWPTNTVRLPQDLKDFFTVRVGSDCPFTNGIFLPNPSIGNTPP
jgi:hypothetical protein